MKLIGLIDPSINSFNLGDQIVMHHVVEILSKEFKDCFFIHVPAYGEVDSRIEEIVTKVDFFIFCGTGPICSDITFRWPLKRWQYSRKVILLGIGANSYNVKIELRAKQIYESNLSKDHIHSARDNFSLNVIEDMGHHRVLNTGCPTLWNIKNTQPKDKSESVLLTFNSSRKNYERDSEIIKILKDNYSKIFFYSQCPNDLQYLKDFNFHPDHIISPNFNQINSFFEREDFDYVGCRLHGGIHALHHKHRSFIVAVDNRAIEMRKDFNLPVYFKPEYITKAINKDYELNLNLPHNNINRWLEQFHV